MTPSAVRIAAWVAPPRRAAATPPQPAGGPAYVDAFVRFRARQWHVSFLIDTGASLTVLSPSDTYDLLADDYQEIDFNRDPARTAIVGIGGTQRGVVRECLLSFRTDQRRFHQVSTRVLIPEIADYGPAARLRSGPSLLGRDILGRGASRWRGDRPPSSS